MLSVGCKKHILYKRIFLDIVKRNILKKFDIAQDFDSIQFLITSFFSNKFTIKTLNPSLTHKIIILTLHS